MDILNSPTFGSNFTEFNNLVKKLKDKERDIQYHVDVVDTIDGYIPYKLTLPTVFSDRGIISLIIEVFFVLILHVLCFFLYFFWKGKNKTLE